MSELKTNWKREKREITEVTLTDLKIKVTKVYEGKDLRNILVDKVYLVVDGNNSFSYTPFKYEQTEEKDEVTGFNLFESKKSPIPLKDLDVIFTEIRKK